MAHVADAPPPTPVEPVAELVHGIELVDPYRWLENQESGRTRRWLKDQDAHTRAYFESLPARAAVRSRVRELLSSPVVSELWKIGSRYFFLKTLEGHEQPSIVVREGLTGEDRVLVDPVSRNDGKLISVAICAVSDDGKFLAYLVRRGGTDHAAIEILDIPAIKTIPDGLPQGHCAGFVFAPDGSGFYYSHRAVRDPRPNYKAVFWHRYGADRAQDVEIFCAGEAANLFLGIVPSAQAKLFLYLVLSGGKEPRISIYTQKMELGANSKCVLRDIPGCFIPFFSGQQLLALTDLAAPNLRIVNIDLNNPDPMRWRDIVAESDRRIQQFAVAGDLVFVTRTDRFKTEFEAFSATTGRRENIPIARHGSVDFLNPGNQTDTLFYSCTSATQPAVVYCYDTRKNEVGFWQRPVIPFDPSMIAVEEVSYLSKDGVSIPLFLAGRKDMFGSGPLPTFLTGYGGFGSCATPRFTAFATFLIEQGVLFAVPALRGGSELGEGWHRAGQRELRQSSFDDFIAAAEWLLSRRHSARDRIAIGGGSNAGLLVGAAITQRPDLFRAAICLGPLLDMVRYHLFDFAAGWAEEYGSPEDERDFHCLLRYSPYHRVQDGTEYPAVLLISGDADTRCNPMHARKMAARLQAANRSEHPILLDYKTAWGHTPVQPMSVKIDSLTDRLAFLCHELGVPVPGRMPS